MWDEPSGQFVLHEMRHVTMALDTLISHPGHQHGSRPPGRRLAWFLAGTVPAVVLLVAAMHGPGAPELGVLSAPDHDDLRVLVLGESADAGDDCPGCRTYTAQFADALADHGRRGVTVENETVVPASQRPADLSVTAGIDTDPRLRERIRGADILLISVGNERSMIGFEDTAEPAGDIAPVPHADAASLSGFDSRLRLLLAAVDRIRRPDATVIVIAAPAPGRSLTRAVARAACLTSEELRTACVDATRLDPVGQLSPHDWSRADYDALLSQRRHDGIARELLRLPVAMSGIDSGGVRSWPFERRGR